MNITVVDPRTSGSVVIATAAGPQGPAGAGNAGGYTHTQATANTVWTIQHNLGYAVTPTVIDSNGQVTFGWTPAWSNTNTLILTFPVPLAGTAHVS